MADLTPADLGAVMNGNRNDDWGGGAGAWWMIILFAMIWGWGRGGFGGNGADGTPVTEAGLCNAMNFNNLENAVGRLNDQAQTQFTQLTNGICNLGYELQAQNNATNVAMLQGFNAVQSQQQDCCCQTQRAIDQVNYNMAMGFAAVQANDTANTQKILDRMCEDKMASMQQQIDQLQLQAALCGVVRYPQGMTYTAGVSPFFNQGCCSGYNNI